MEIQKPPPKKDLPAHCTAPDIDYEAARVEFLKHCTDPKLISMMTRVARPDEIYKENCGGKPLKNITPRFQLFSGFLYFVNHLKYKPFNLYGHITIYNRYGEDDDSDSGVSIIFKRPSDEPFRILNRRVSFPLNNPPSQRSIPLYTSLDIVVDLTAVTPDDEDDKVSVQLTNDPKDFKLTVEKYDTFCQHQIEGPEGLLNLHYIILTDPVDADLEMTFHPQCDVTDKLFLVKIWAFYNKDYGPFPLLDVAFLPLLENGKIPLNTSSLAVPATGYNLVIRAMIIQVGGEMEQDISIDQFLHLTPKLKGSTISCIHGKYCRIQVRVNWKYEADTEQNDVAADEIYTCKECEELKTHDELQKKKRKKKKSKKKKVNVNGKYEAGTQQNDVATTEIHSLKECEDLETCDEPAVEIRRKILKKIMKLRTKKQRLTRMDANWKYTEDDELELESLQLRLSKMKVVEGERLESQNKDKE